MPGTWIVQLDRAGFAPDVTTATVEVDQTVEVAVEAALSDLADADMDLQGITMDREILADLQDTGVTLRGADLTQVSIEGVLDDLALDLSEVQLIEGALDGAVLGEAQLVLADMTGASMAGVGLSGANLTGAILVDVQASGADLSGAVLDGANLNGALLIRADLSGASLVGATLDDANLTGVTFTDDTVCPNGQTHAELPGCGL